MKITREIKAGVIVLGGILLLILGLNFLKSTPLFANNKVFYAVYDHVGGLQPGTQVSINGYAVGKVSSIGFKDESGKLLVTFTVDKDFDFSRNSSAELFDTGIIGGKGIQIRPVFDGAPMAKSGDTLVTSTRPGLTELVQQKLTPLQMKVEGAVSNADSLLANFNQVMDGDTKQNLREAIKGMNALVGSLQQTASSLNQLMEANKNELDSTLSNLANVSRNFSDLSDSLSTVGLPQTLRKFDASLASLSAMMQKMENGEGTMGKLMQDEALYNQLTETTRELDLLLQDFRLNPKRYVNVSVFGKKQKEYELPEDDPAANKN